MTITGFGPSNTTNNITAPSPTDYNSTEFPDVKSGSMFIAASGLLTVGLLGYLRMTIANPSNSTMALLIRELDFFSSVAALAWAHLYVNPTAGLPATSARPVNNLNFGGSGNPSPIAVIKADLVSQIGNPALSGGTDTGVDIGFGGAVNTQLVFPPLIIRPGTTLGISASITASAATSLVVRWLELSGV